MPEVQVGLPVAATFALPTYSTGIDPHPGVAEQFPFGVGTLLLRKKTPQYCMFDVYAG